MPEYYEVAEKLRDNYIEHNRNTLLKERLGTESPGA
jgi:hypothetical protein